MIRDISKRDLATILAALRYWQDFSPLYPLNKSAPMPHAQALHLIDIGTNDGRFPSMLPAEIDELCERLSLGPGLGDNLSTLLARDD